LLENCIRWIQVNAIYLLINKLDIFDWTSLQNAWKNARERQSILITVHGLNRATCRNIDRHGAIIEWHTRELTRRNSVPPDDPRLTDFGEAQPARRGAERRNEAPSPARNVSRVYPSLSPRKVRRTREGQVCVRSAYAIIASFSRMYVCRTSAKRPLVCINQSHGRDQMNRDM